MSSLIDPPALAAPEEPELATQRFYTHALGLLDKSGFEYLIGGGYAMAHYTGIVRPTKDLDVFCRPRDRDPIMRLFADAGHRTDLTWPHFLGKILEGEAFIDVIYRSGNGLCEVDDEWFEHAVHGQVLGHPVLLCPIEETIWSKSFVMERDRYDGHDVNHLILRQSDHIDWKRLARRFRGHERILLAHVMMYGYVYPTERHRVPDWFVEQLEAAVKDEPPARERLCRGGMLSKWMYTSDFDHHGYIDPRLSPRGIMTPAEATHFQTGK